MVQATGTTIGLQWRRITFISGMAMMLFLCSNKSACQTTSKELKPYQKYCYNRIQNAMANDGSYTISDDFRLYQFYETGFGWGDKFFTRTIDNSDYVFIVWKTNGGKPILDFETRISKMDYRKDTILDFNGDKQKDFSVYWQPRNGSCQPLMADVFISDTSHKSFLQITAFEQIPNPIFDAKHKKVTSTITCNYKVDDCIYQWKGNKLEEINCKTEAVK